ncbi:MAG: tetraacyldisaccharide 4'-kinase [Gammaproteobacteria bacterium]|nr:tetraacyldisaccharide 4'-kinase [Gammaproteobacteria bacterium]
MTESFRTTFESYLNKQWYSQSRSAKLLSPCSWIFGQLVRRRRRKFLSGKKVVWSAPVPVCVVGNLTVGGTGKTPLVAWLADWLTARGARVGIVSRGYGGSSSYPLEVTESTSVREAGDEALLLARRTKCPVVVDPRRVAATQTLLSNHAIDLVLSDDGLQHYALGRDIEVLVIDGARGHGNGMLLPAGPLREPIDRIESVDWVVANGKPSRLVDHEWVMHFVAREMVNVATETTVCVDKFREMHGAKVSAMSAIGNPARFKETLVDLGFRPSLTAFKDHYRFKDDDFNHVQNGVLVVTEKDAQKIRELPQVAPDTWFPRIEIQFDGDVDRHLSEMFGEHEIELSDKP